MTTNFRLFQTEEFADDNFKFDKNGRKLFNRVQNTVGKGEIARYKQKACFQGVTKGVWEWVNKMFQDFFNTILSQESTHDRSSI